ncbi:FRAS1 [Branchiostoma lanceolatum]|uniref:FRAS1 protein n=1 Tax=Branchiostoma lanceolatum TaxID=7740 RepID=A0A8J9ZRP1_BRALA|nr:FRAS1 [Branchiostoma lanceolatum]
MLWKLLLSTLVMFVAIRGAVGQGFPPGGGDGPDVWPPPGGDPTMPPPPPEPQPEPDHPTLPNGPGPACSVDIVFVVDESSSISSSWFDRAKEFMIYFQGCFSRLHDIWVGVIPYHCVPRTYQRLSPPFGTFMFDQLMQTGGLSRPGLAIRFMKDTSDFRDGVPRAAVVLTDGQSEDPAQVMDIAAETDAARAAGIELYAVGVGDPVDYRALEAIGGSSDHVFRSDMPCKVAYRILADLCKLAGVPGCVSFEGDAILPLGSSYQPETEGCITCGCSDDGQMVCSGVGCALRNPPCENPVNIAGRCCPECADDDEVPEGCQYKDAIIPVGEEYKPNDCTTCTCPAAGAEPECVSMACIALYCPNPVKIVGQCCPICGGCQYGDVVIPVGSTYQPDPCTYCSCEAAGARPLCAVQDCAAPPCANPEHVPGQCCPVCHNIGCEHAHGLILPGNDYKVDACMTCTCPFPGEEPMCYTPGCMPPECDAPVQVAGQCCPVCDAPDGCLHEEDFVIIPVGARIPQQDPCVVCTCPFAGGRPICERLPCPAIACPNAVYLAGVCCPVCNM